MLAVEPSLFAFVAGLASFLSPCVFPLVPVYAGYISGRITAPEGAALQPAMAGAGAPLVAPRPAPRQVPVLASGVAFVLGFSAVFVVLFYVLAVAELPFQARYRREIDIISGLVVIALALQLLGVLRIERLMREWKLFTVRPGAGLLASFLLGVSFAAGWTPCIGVQLGAILTVAANGSFSALPFMLLYCAGLAVPFLIVTVLAERLQGTLRALNRGLGVVNLIAGALLIIFGVLLLTDRITILNSISPSAPFGT